MNQSDFSLSFDEMAKAVESAIGVHLDPRKEVDLKRLQEIIADLVSHPDSPEHSKILQALETLLPEDKECESWSKTGAPLKLADGVHIPDDEDLMLDDVSFKKRDKKHITSDNKQAWHPTVIHGVAKRATNFENSFIVEMKHRSLLEGGVKPRFILTKDNFDLVVSSPDSLDLKFIGERLQYSYNLQQWSKTLFEAERALKTSKHKNLFYYFYEAVKNTFHTQHATKIINVFYGNNSSELKVSDGSKETSVRYVVSGNDVFMKIIKSNGHIGKIETHTQKASLDEGYEAAHWLAEQFSDDPDTGVTIVHSLREGLSAG
ncbi:hypothetical protein [Pseudomonas moorei]|uniref:hypothetical protein n=1 Tax=Pseudomonas moorei TaxID=395599 RepID=UPI001FF13B67|nr:hypothetical protein [Pseudomonas moorei]